MKKGLDHGKYLVWIRKKKGHLCKFLSKVVRDTAIFKLN